MARDLPRPLQAFQQGQLLRPGDQVVDLVEIDPPAKPVQGALGLGLALCRRGASKSWSPPAPGRLRRPAERHQHALASPYIGEESKKRRPAASAARTTARAFASARRAAHVEGLPGAHADRRHL